MLSYKHLKYKDKIGWKQNDGKDILCSEHTKMERLLIWDKIDFKTKELPETGKR